MDYLNSADATAIVDKSLTATPLPDETAVNDDLPEKISAYYSLAFPNFTYYVQTITVSIGRRSVRPDVASSSTDASQVDIDLGPLKSVSRLHARIEYDEAQEQFILAVLGRNGAWVDGVWSGSGSRVPLGPRSQLQIATRVFHFILPPAPDDSPSPSSPSSTTRHFSPSIDVTSVSPDSSVQSPAGKDIDLPATDDIKAEPLEPQLTEKKPVKANGKKRKKPIAEVPPPPPDVMPPRPQATYAQLCYRAINSLNGKATLQEICQWIAENHDWYRYNKGTGWESSVRHNLSSNRAFKKMERCAGERGKGFFWSIDPHHEHIIKELEAKANGENVKVKNPKLLEPPLRRSVKGDTSQPLPPPLSTTPLHTQNLQHTSHSGNTSVPQRPPSETSTLKKSSSPEQGTSSQVSQQVASFTSQFKVESVPKAAIQPNNMEHSPSTNPTTGTSMPAISSDIVIPIVIGSIPSAANASETSNKTQLPSDMSSLPIALHNDTIILNPTIFSSLTSDQLKELEALGAKKAIEILQGYIVRYLKEKRKAESKEKKKSKKKRKEAKEGASGAETGCASEAAVGKHVAEGVTSKDNLVASEPKALSPTSDMIRAVAPLRISTPPPLDASTTLEEIDIMGEDDEPSLKRRRMDVDDNAVELA